MKHRCPSSMCYLKPREKSKSVVIYIHMYMYIYIYPLALPPESPRWSRGPMGMRHAGYSKKGWGCACGGWAWGWGVCGALHRGARRDALVEDLLDLEARSAIRAWRLQETGAGAAHTLDIPVPPTLTHGPVQSSPSASLVRFPTCVPSCRVSLLARDDADVVERSTSFVARCCRERRRAQTHTWPSLHCTLRL